MAILKKYKIKRVLSIFTWIIISGASIALLAASVNRNDVRKCAGINITISGASNHFFIDKHDVENIIVNQTGKNIKNKTLQDFDLRKIEKILERDIWVNNAELFFDTEGVLQVFVDEKEPVARVFTAGGFSYYIDSAMNILPLSEKFSARVPVFTNFPSDSKVLTGVDKNLMAQVLTIANELNADSFLMAMIDQIDISNRQFELFPKIGDQVILFGGADDYENKFRRLKLFYKNVIPKTGVAKYNVINLKFKDQVVAKIRSKEDIISDSLQTIRLMKAIAEYTQQRAGDTLFTKTSEVEKNTDESMVMQSFQRDEPGEMTIYGMPNISSETLIKSANIDASKKSETKTIVAPSPQKKQDEKKEVKVVPVTKPKEKTKVVNKPIVKEAKKEKIIEKPKEKPVKTEKINKDKPVNKVPKAVMPKEHEKIENDY